MVGIEVDRLGLQLRPILDGLRDLGRKHPDVDSATLQTGFDFGPVFGHVHPHQRHVKHLPFFVVADCHLSQRGWAVLTRGDGMHPGVLGLCHGFQRMPGMTRSPAAGLATRLAQTARLRLGESIAGRRFAAVATVLGLLILQRWDAGF